MNKTVPFLLGGFGITMLKFMATRLRSPIIAAIIGAIPVGFLAIYFIEEEKSREYILSYFKVTSLLLLSTILFYILITRYSIPKNTALLMSFCIWLTMVLIFYYLSSR